MTFFEMLFNLIQWTVVCVALGGLSYGAMRALLLLIRIEELLTAIKDGLVDVETAVENVGEEVNRFRADIRNG
jgi:hypothetical protein